MTPSPTALDAERVLVWMRAAARVSPELAEAYLWQYDLLSRLGRDDDALAALERYCRLNRADLSARIDLLEGRFERLQSVDRRLAFCREMLARADIAGSEPGSELIRSGLHRRMADLHLRSGDTSGAEQEARRAVETFPGNAAALALLVELADEKDRPARQVRASLAAIAASPADASAMWRLARALDDLGLTDEALAWYGRARQAMERASPGRPPPGEFLFDEARSHADAGRYEQALESADQLVAADPNNIAGRFLLLDLATRMAKGEVIQAQKTFLSARFADAPASRPTSAPASQPADPDRTLHAAWYYTLFDPDPAKAVRFAAEAKDSNPQSGEVIYGLAKLLSGDLEEAARALAPHAPRDPWAAAGLGEALLKQGKRDEGLAALRAGESLRGAGLAHERIAALLTTEGESLRPRTPPADALDAIKAFDRRVLDFADAPAGSLRLEVSSPQTEWAFGDPWQCEVRLTNTAAYPVFIGEGRMIEGTIIAGLSWGEGPARRWSGYLPMALDDRPVLPPGASISRNLTLDVGPAEALARSLPQRDLDLVIRFVLDPIPGPGGEWASALREFPAAEFKIKRPAVDASRTGLDRWMKLAREGSEPERIRAVAVLGALLRERESAVRKALDYEPRRVDESKLAQELLAALKDPAAVVRATALEALRGTTFTKRTFEQVAPLLADPDWLVRLTALDVLAEVQGEKLRPVLERLSTADGDPLVKRAAELSLAAISPAAK